MRFVVEYRNKLNVGEGLVLPSLNSIEAETLPLAQREVEKVLATGATDEAVIYEPRRVLKASRTISTSDIHGRAVRESEAPALPTTDTGVSGE